MPLVTDQLPAEGMEVRLFGIFGEKRGYWKSVLGVPVWMESVDGPDVAVVDTVVSWLPRDNPLWKL